VLSLMENSCLARLGRPSSVPEAGDVNLESRRESSRGTLPQLHLLLFLQDVEVARHHFRFSILY
jgi:hypothetical protein